MKRKYSQYTRVSLLVSASEPRAVAQPWQLWQEDKHWAWPGRLLKSWFSWDLQDEDYPSSPSLCPPSSVCSLMLVHLWRNTQIRFLM